MIKKICIKMQTIFVGLFLLFNYCDGLIVPQEIVSASHSAIYPNVPVVKKGTDSRFGFGFRLGEHSDFQFLFELGPQKYTKPIGKGPSDDDSFASKRMVDQSDFRQTVKPRSAKVIGGNFLQKWANEMKTKTKTKTTQKTRKPQIESAGSVFLKSLFSIKDQYPLPASLIIPDTSVLLVKKNNSPIDQSPPAIGALPSKTIKTRISAARRDKSDKLKKDKIKADLSDVSLDD